MTFSATNCLVPATEQQSVNANGRVLVGALQRVAQSPEVYAINRNEAYGTNAEGSIFVANLREVRPFEAYTLHTNGSRPFVTVEELMGDKTGIGDAVRITDGEKTENNNVYNLGGQRVTTPQKGVYIVSGKKKIVR
ncbi:MAG: hypothetical protein IJ200_00245 [Prevotella sp.]|nr:hypothetical protein [Prevotella sp.]